MDAYQNKKDPVKHYNNAPHLGVNVSADGLWYPGCLVELGPPLLLRVSRYICHQLENKSFTKTSTVLK